MGVRLGFTGAIRDDVMDMEDLASRLMAYLGAHYPEALTERYKIAVEPGEPGWELLEKAGRKRGFPHVRRRGEHRAHGAHSAR